MPDDEVLDAEADEEWDDEEWDEDEVLLFGYPARTVKITAGAIAVVLLLLIAARTIPSFGFYSGVGNLMVEIDPEEHYLPDDVELNALVLANAPSLGRLAKEGSYSVHYDGEEMTTGKFTLNDDGRKNLRIPYDDFFVDNGEYTLKIDISGTEATDKVELNLIAKVIEASILFTGQNLCTDGDDDGDYDCEPVYTTITFFSSTNLVERKRVAPEGEGEIEIYFYQNNEPSDSEKEDETYWQSDDDRSCSGDAADCFGDEWTLLHTISFALDFTSGYWQYETGSPTQFEEDVGYVRYQMALDTDYFRQDDDGDYTMRITFTNSYNSDVDGADTEQKEGRSDYRWFFLNSDD